MKLAQPLPADLVDRYAGWRSASYQPRSGKFETLVRDGQHPIAMVISCCDSRVHPTEIFGAEEGTFFVHRNIASLVPPCDADGQYHGTPAAVEYAMSVLKVPHLIVIGHSQCGGVQGCADMCAGKAPALESKDSFVGRWIEILRPGYAKVAHLEGREQTLALEQQGVLLSLENLMSYPFVASRVDAGEVQLHGLWIDIAKGELQGYVPETGAFQPL